MRLPLTSERPHGPRATVATERATHPALTGPLGTIRRLGAQVTCIRQSVEYAVLASQPFTDMTPAGMTDPSPWGSMLQLFAILLPPIVSMKNAASSMISAGE